MAGDPLDVLVNGTFPSPKGGGRDGRRTLWHSLWPDHNPRRTRPTWSDTAAHGHDPCSIMPRSRGIPGRVDLVLHGYSDIRPAGYAWPVHGGRWARHGFSFIAKNTGCRAKLAQGRRLQVQDTLALGANQTRPCCWRWMAVNFWSFRGEGGNCSVQALGWPGGRGAGMIRPILAVFLVLLPVAAQAQGLPALTIDRRRGWHKLVLCPCRFWR